MGKWIGPNKKEYDKAYYLKHSERIKARAAKWYVDNRERRLSYILEYNYGLSKDDYDDMLEAQGGRCAICFEPPTPLKGRLSVDHDHATDQVRQLLCLKCNQMLGYALDNPDILRRGAEYIEKHAALKGLP